MIRKTFIFYWLLLIVLLSCRDKHPLRTSVSLVKFKLDNPQQISTLDLLEHSEIIFLELTKDSGIDRIEKVLMDDNAIFLINHLERSNSRYLLAFDREGHYKWGQFANAVGPGKFVGYDDFILSGNNEIEIMDGLQNKIIKYDYNGDYIMQFPVYGDASKLAKFTDGTYVCHRNNTYQFGEEIFEYNLAFMDREGNRYGSAFILIHPAARDLAISGERFFTALEKDTYLCTSPLNDTIYTCSPGTATPLFVLDYPEKVTKDAALEELQKEPSFVGNRGDYNLAFLNFLNNPEFIPKYEIVAERENYYWLAFRMGGKRYFVKIDKESLVSGLFTLDDSLLDKTHIFKLNENSIALVFKNPYVVREWLKDRKPELAEKWFGELEGGEPNPILITMDIDFLEHLDQVQ